MTRTGKIHSGLAKANFTSEADHSCHDPIWRRHDGGSTKRRRGNPLLHRSLHCTDGARCAVRDAGSVMEGWDGKGKGNKFGHLRLLSVLSVSRLRTPLSHGSEVPTVHAERKGPQIGQRRRSCRMRSRLLARHADKEEKKARQDRRELRHPTSALSCLPGWDSSTPAGRAETGGGGGETRSTRPLLQDTLQAHGKGACQTNPFGQPVIGRFMSFLVMCNSTTIALSVSVSRLPPSPPSSGHATSKRGGRAAGPRAEPTQHHGEWTEQRQRPTTSPSLARSLGRNQTQPPTES